VTAGWLWLLLGCLHFDVGEREPGETARQATYQIGQQTGSGQVTAWACEMAAWFALTAGRLQRRHRPLPRRSAACGGKPRHGAARPAKSTRSGPARPAA
jgi:hypothetical protein